MNARHLYFSVAAAALVAGCAPRIRLPMQSLGPATLARVVIDDARPAEDKGVFRTTSSAMCARSYGDGFVEPSVVTYVQTLLAARAAEGAPLNVRIDRLDVLERCQRWRKRHIKAGFGGLIGSAISVPETPDTFTLQFVGTVNGAPVRFRRGFEYSDAEYKGYPPDTERFKARVSRLFDDLANAIVKPAPAYNAPESDIEDLRAIYRARQPGASAQPDA